MNREVQENSGISVDINIPQDFQVADLATGDRLFNSQSPFIDEVPEQVVILVDKKPIALDTILPLILELRNENPELPVIWLIKDRGHIDLIRQNYVLWNAMLKTGRIACFSDNRKGILRKTRARVLQIKWMWSLLRCRTYLLNHGDFASPPIDLLAMSVRRGGGRIIGYARWCYPMSRVRVAGRLEMQGNQGKGLNYFRCSGDFWLIPHPLHAQHLCGMVNCAQVVVGTPRAYPVWKEYLEECLRDAGIKGVDGHRIEYAERNILCVFYPGNHHLPEMRTATACRDQLLIFLAAVKEVAPDTLILIKPHTICDLDELGDDIRAFDDLDIHITFAHPQVLAHIISAAIFTNGSNVMDDMYVEQVAVVDISLYTEAVKEAGSSFPNVGRLEASAAAEMRRVIRRILLERDALPKPECAHLLWPKAMSISACLWGKAASVEQV